MLGGFFLHIGTYTSNDYFDHTSGTDDAPSDSDKSGMSDICYSEEEEEDDDNDDEEDKNEIWNDNENLDMRELRYFDNESSKSENSSIFWLLFLQVDFDFKSFL